MQEVEELRGARERDVDVLDHRLGVQAAQRSSARVSPMRLFQRMIRLVGERAEPLAAVAAGARSGICAPTFFEHQNQSVSQRQR